MKILSREQFAYDVASIGGYVDQVGGELLSKALIGGTTARYANVRLGIKGTQALNLLFTRTQVPEIHSLVKLHLLKLS